jgi:bacillithiol biosynthesis deacetylase BshB1
MNDKPNEGIDLLATGAHPDDIELGAGGTVAKFTREGFSVIGVDFTRGEMGSRGTPEIRLEEAKKAAVILGLKDRLNLGFPDTKLTLNDETVFSLISVIREYRPKIVLAPPEFDLHPDHVAVHYIVREAAFKSGLHKIETEWEGKPQKPYRPRKIFGYMQSFQYRQEPSFYIDISDTFTIKIEASKAHASQIYIPGVSKDEGPVTRLYVPDFLEKLEARARYFGSLIGVKYAEAFLSVEPVGLRSLSVLL